MNPALALLLACLLVGLSACKKDEVIASAPPQSQSPDNQPVAPMPLPVPTVPQTVVLAEDDLQSRLVKLTRELHRTMVGRRLSGDFDEFARIANLEVPPAPPGKKYAISKQWKVVVVDAK